jgi:hypothetical protein
MIRRPWLSVLCLALSFPALALQDMSDEALSATDAQAGLNISLINLQESGVGVTWQDYDGVAAYSTAVGTTSPGSMNLNGLALATTGITSLKFDVGAAGSAAAINIAVSSPSATVSMAGTASAALGFNALTDICSSTAGNVAACTMGAANDRPLLVMPSSGASLSMTLTSLSFNLQAGNAPQGHLGLLTDGGAMSFVLGNTGSNAVGLAFADAANVVQAGTVVGGVGVKNITLTGVDFGQTVGTNYTALDVCNGVSGSALCTNLGKAGVGLTFFGTAMTGINISVNNLTAGNIGTGATVTGTTYIAAGTAPNYGSYNVTGLSLAGASLMVSGH